MAYRISWDPSAAGDLERVLEYLEHAVRSPQAAARFLDRINKVQGIIAALPASYPRVTDPYLRARGYRRAVAGSYLVIFRIAEQWASVEDGQVLEREGAGGREGIIRIAHLRHTDGEWEAEL